MADFDDVAISLNMHFCSECQASFECDYEDGYCDCPFSNYFSDPQCDDCVELYLEERGRKEKDEED